MLDKPLRVLIVGDSQCTIAALEKPNQSITDMVEDVVIDPVYHISGKN